ncbi:hypothetical protein PMAYCL1PPCAC_15575, partial [Pristionchus mayeri]
DLKPDNLAVSANGKLTLLDFGIARAKDDNEPLTKGPGNEHYRAIETISFGESEVKIYNEKADMWPIGAILSDMITNRILFEPGPSEGHLHKNPILKAITICGPIPEIVIREEVDYEPSKNYLRDKSSTAVRINFIDHFLETGRPWLRDEIVRKREALANFIDRTLKFDHRQRMSVDEALAHPFLGDVREPAREVTASHSISDYGEHQVEEWKQLIWDVIKETPVRLK